MPINCPGGEDPRYRTRTTKGGQKQRLAFCGNEVVEVKTGGKTRRLMDRSTKGSPAFTDQELRQGYRKLS